MHASLGTCVQVRTLLPVVEILPADAEIRDAIVEDLSSSAVGGGLSSSFHLSSLVRSSTRRRTDYKTVKVVEDPFEMIFPRFLSQLLFTRTVPQQYVM